MKQHIKSIEDNLFPGCHAAISDWENFRWHEHACQPKSSQALAIDVFGTIKMSPEKNHILSEIAACLNLPEQGDWEIELEWKDPQNLLKEMMPAQTQIDCIATSAQAVIVFECKLKEGGDSCGQPNSGQCNGNYETQINPKNHKKAKCALAGKGIRYWDYIDTIFREVSSKEDYQPCPFKGENYQWMRNLALCKALMKDGNKAGAVVAVYADAPNLKMAEKINKKAWKLDLNNRKVEFTDSLESEVNFKTLSYQKLIEMIRQCSSSATWHDLKNWVDNKIERVSRQQG